MDVLLWLSCHFPPPMPFPTSAPVSLPSSLSTFPPGCLMSVCSDITYQLPRWKTRHSPYRQVKGRLTWHQLQKLTRGILKTVKMGKCDWKDPLLPESKTSSSYKWPQVTGEDGLRLSWVRRPYNIMQKKRFKSSCSLKNTCETAQPIKAMHIQKATRYLKDLRIIHVFHSDGGLVRIVSAPRRHSGAGIGSVAPKEGWIFAAHA